MVLNFWASWCKPCTEELPLLERTHRAIAGRGALVLGANYQDVSDNALGFVRRFKLTYPSLRDRDGEFADRYGSRAFPRRSWSTAAGGSPRSGAALSTSVARSHAAAAAGGEGVRRALLASCCCLAAARRRGLAARHRGRGDVRPVQDRPQRLDLGRRRPGARLHPPPDRPGQGQAAGQGRAGGGVRARRAGAPEEKGFDLAAYLVPIALALLALAGLVVAARRWRRRPPEARRRPSRSTDDDARRLDAELAAYDRR